MAELTEADVDSEEAEVPALMQRVGRIGRMSPEEILDAYIDWVLDQGFEPYPAQEAAMLELMAGRHLILNTPTGSGKSLVAQALQFKALCEGKRSFYTAPTKALASEKFFALCRDFGPENVGMLTGDASINAAAPVICCTAEILANMALRQGSDLQVPYVIMDEFHYYADAARGAAWQIPLLTLPNTRFLLMSATLGPMDQIREDLEARTGVEVARVDSAERPVPLDYVYCDTPLVETIEDLLAEGKAPVYIVSFTQRECAELAQGLTSLKLCTREEKEVLRDEIGDFAFDTAYGKDMRRFLASGVGIHHAGLLPRYRLLVEQLSQKGLLKVICGTDTLGVGVNIPIRTVLFTKLSKFDGRRDGILRVRDFKQIAGRAGRKGHDDQGSVVCQAPAHIIENKRARSKMKGKRAKGGKAGKGGGKTAKAPRGFVAWNADTFDSLIRKDPEPLTSRFRLNHGILMNVLRRDEGYRALISLIDATHETPHRKKRLRRESAQLFRAMRGAGIFNIEPDPDGRRKIRVNEDLQWDFSLNHALSLFAMESVSTLDENDEDYALDVMSFIEAILEDPRAILYSQMDRLKRDLMIKLKQERVPFEERIRLLDEVEPPQPSRDLIYEHFEVFADRHPWVLKDDVKPKSIAREMYENYFDFTNYVNYYGLQRIEGVLLRYLSQFYSTVTQTVPEAEKTQEVLDMLAFFRTLLERVDSSLLEEWEGLVRPGDTVKRAGDEPKRKDYDLARDPRSLYARIRAQMHQLVRALARNDFDEAARSVREAEGEGEAWDAARFRQALGPFLHEFGKIDFTPRARYSEHTQILEDGPRRWKIVQRLLDPEDEADWYIEAIVDLTNETAPEGPLLRIAKIAS